MSFKVEALLIPVFILIVPFNPLPASSNAKRCSKRLVISCTSLPLLPPHHLLSPLINLSVHFLHHKGLHQDFTSRQPIHIHRPLVSFPIGRIYEVFGPSPFVQWLESPLRLDGFMWKRWSKICHRSRVFYQSLIRELAGEA
ncbi:hypothetical protein BDZ45DRAFT_743332 [Acephala macrosclerotiorum]|nr:hypothetical protein BDZ45DRAFT_743332 [Acephala macrosclerotiorum]